MSNYAIGILRETNRLSDQRVAITPSDARWLLDSFPFLKIKVQPSDLRAFKNEEYIECGIEMCEDLTDCDLLIGLKEVNIDAIIPGKKYLFFAHVAKKQKHHQHYFRQLASKKITLIDYEYITNDRGKRIVAFGHWAGIVGVYYAFIAIGKRHNLFELPPTMMIDDYKKMIDQLNKVSIPPIKLLISGGGRVATGVVQTLEKLKIDRIDPEVFLTQTFNKPVFCQLKSADYLVNINGEKYNKSDYRKHPGQYRSIFFRFAKEAHLYFACHFWKNGQPAYLTEANLMNSVHHLKIVTDISCDIKGPIACSMKESTHEEPIYDYNPKTGSIETPFSSSDNINVIAISNLPTALPRDSSSYFSNILCSKVLPKLISRKNSTSINKSIILEKGKLTPGFLYLYDFLNHNRNDV